MMKIIHSILLLLFFSPQSSNAMVGGYLSKGMQQMSSKTVKKKLPSQIRSLIYEKFGNPIDVLTLKHIALPNPGPKEILVKMKLSSINPSDLIPMTGAYSSIISLPAVAGYEGVGEVVECGDEVNSSSIGQRVLALRGKGTWQDYVVVPADEAIEVPNEINDETAAQLYINPLTAWVMLREDLKLKAGSTIAINAGGSAFGRIVAKLSKIFDYRLISVVRSDFYDEVLSNEGVEHIINTSKVSSLNEAIMNLTEGKGVDVSLECVGGDDGLELAKCVKLGGTMLHYGLLSGKQIPSSVHHLDIDFRHFWLRKWNEKTDSLERKVVFKEMIETFVKHNISLDVQDIYDIEDYQEALKAANSSSRKGKILLEINKETDK